MPQATKKTNKSILEKWQTWLTVLLGILGIISWFLELPQKLSTFVSTFSATQPREEILEQPLSGSIRDEANEPLSGVRVSLPEYGATVTTDWLGHFRLQVKAPYQASVELLVQKDDYQTYEQYVTLGNTRVSFTMHRKE